MHFRLITEGNTIYIWTMIRPFPRYIWSGSILFAIKAASEHLQMRGQTTGGKMVHLLVQKPLQQTTSSVSRISRSLLTCLKINIYYKLNYKISFQCVKTVWIHVRTDVHTWSGSKLFSKVITRRQRLPLAKKSISEKWLCFWLILSLAPPSQIFKKKYSSQVSFLEPVLLHM